MATTSTGFIITRNWRDTDQGVELEFWLSTDEGARRLLVPAQEVVLFLPREDVERARAVLGGPQGEAPAAASAAPQGETPAAAGRGVSAAPQGETPAAAGRGMSAVPQGEVPAVSRGEHFFYRLRELPLRDFKMRPVVAFYFNSQRQLRRARDRLIDAGLEPLEADINPAERFLMERFVAGSIEFEQPSNPPAAPAAQGNGTSRQTNAAPRAGTAHGNAAAQQADAAPRAGAAHNGDASYRGKAPPGNPPKVRAADYTPRLKMLSVDIETALRGIELYSIGAYARIDGVVERRVFMVGDGAGGGNSKVADSGASDGNRNGGAVGSGAGDSRNDSAGNGADAIDPCLRFFPNERAALRAFCDWLQVFDPDVLIGWNVVNFDLWFLQRLAEKLKVRLELGRGRRPPHWRQLDDEGERRAVHIPGRAVIDGIEMLRTATYRFESFSLENVAGELLGQGKLLKGDHRGDAIARLFAEDKRALAEYNLKDCELVWDIFEQTRLLEFAVARSQMTGLALDRLGGSVAAFDHLYLPQLHRAGYIAPNASRAHLSSPGGFVLDSVPGIYDNVLVLDFKSLYPSIIRTFYIDPLGLALGSAALGDSGAATATDPAPDASPNPAASPVLNAGSSPATGSTLNAGSNPATDSTPAHDLVPGFLDAHFAREPAILPGIIARLWELRDAAKARGDGAQSQAIKIIMNSFYGVLGTAGCRFFDARLASSITRRGHQILQETRDRIEALGDRVIYGDTDSVFVQVRQVGPRLGDEELRGEELRGEELRGEELKGEELKGDDLRRAVAERGRFLEQTLNRYWTERLRAEYNISSVLELEFETHYLRFLMPTVRGSEKGSKKRYAGVVERDGSRQLVFRGLENVRTDWTALARRFQSELYRRVFFDEPYREYIEDTVAALEAGELDAELIYRKRLRRKLGEYERNVPPHVQAARLMGERGLAPPRRGDWVEYVVTRRGAEPVAAAEAALDYQHYLERQLAPVADGILHFLNTSFAEITGRQFSLF